MSIARTLAAIAAAAAVVAASAAPAAARLEPYRWLPTGQNDDGTETYEWVKINRLPYLNAHRPDAHIDGAYVGYAQVTGVC